MKGVFDEIILLYIFVEKNFQRAKLTTTIDQNYFFLILYYTNKTNNKIG